MNILPITFKVDRFIGKKEGAAGSSAFPENKVRRREMLGRVAAASPM